MLSAKFYLPLVHKACGAGAAKPMVGDHQTTTLLACLLHWAVHLVWLHSKVFHQQQIT